MTQFCALHNRILEDWFALYEGGRIVELRQIAKYSNTPEIGDRFIAQIKQIDMRLNAAFLDIGTQSAFLPFKGARPKFMIEGAKIIVEITRRAQSDKLCLCKYIGDAPIGEIAPKALEKTQKPKNWPETFDANNEQIQEIETVLEELKSNRLAINGGGDFEIGYTRAIIAIDIDAGAREKGGKHQTHFNKTLNLDAALEIGRQIRLRNLCGLIIIDFAGGLDPETAKMIEANLRQKIGPQICKIFFNYKLGICEIARERTSEPLFEVFANAAARDAIDGVYELSKQLSRSKGRVVKLETSAQAVAFLEDCKYNWREHFNNNIGGIFEIDACREYSFEIRFR